MNDFKTLDRYIVKVDRSKESTAKVGDTELIIETSYNPYQHITQQGVVVVLPASKKAQVEDVKVGDTIYFHHFTCAEENDVSSYFDSFDSHYMVQKMNVYARTRGEHTCALQNFVFLDPIEESEEDIKTASGIYTKATTDKLFRTGVVRYSVNPKLKGLKVVYKMNHDYEMIVAGDTLYRMTEASLLAHLTSSGTRVPMADSYIVKDLESDEKKITLGGHELIIPGMAQFDDGMRTKFKKGLIIRSGEDAFIETGTTIIYRKGLERKDEFSEGGEKYFMLKEENVEAILED